MYSPSLVEKLAFVLMKAMGLLLVGGNKKTMRRPSASSGDISRREVWISFLVMVFPRKRQNSENSLSLGERVAHTNKNFWLFLLPDRPITLNKYGYK